MIATFLVIALLHWPAARPTVYVCDPGHAPTTPSNCEQVSFKEVHRSEPAGATIARVRLRLTFWF